MRNTSEYWAEIRERRAELELEHGPDGTVWLRLTTSRHCVGASPAVAAKCLCDGTHQLATEDDLRHFREFEASQKRRAEAAARRRGQTHTFVIR